ncbi:MAG: transglycosylase SLT domain-containing protein [Bacteroidales bacterium]
MNKWINYLQNHKKTVILKSIVVFILCSIILSLIFVLKQKPLLSFRSWEEIKLSKTLKVGILYNYTDYYISHGNVYGFHYELIKKMAQHYDLHVDYEVYATYSDYCYALLQNKVDMLAMDISKNMATDILFDFTIPHSYSSLVLIQHKKHLFLQSGDTSLSEEKKEYQIAVPAYTSFHAWAIMLNKQYRNRMTTLINNHLVEDLLDEVNNANIDFTIANRKNAHANSIFYPYIDYSYILSQKLPLHWVVKKGNDSLRFYMNLWLDNYMERKEYKILLKKYYNPKSSTRIALKNKSRITPFGNISPYDNIILKYANQYGLDWLLISSLIYQESRFHAHTSGGGGSYGLMQFMPATADYWGMNIGDSPEKQIKAGCRYLKFLQTKYRNLGVNDSIQLMKFMLAAYNAGSCRVDDAIKLAKRKGYNATVWDNHVGNAFGLLSDRKSIKNSNLKCGRYANTKHTLRYINDIMYRYNHYQNIQKQTSAINKSN